MKLSELLKEIQYTRVIMPKEEVDILGVNIDSRLVEKGDLFIAVRGTQTDGHAYIGAAEEKGAVAIVCEELPERHNRKIGNYILWQPFSEVEACWCYRNKRQNNHCDIAIYPFQRNGT